MRRLMAVAAVGLSLTGHLLADSAASGELHVVLKPEKSVLWQTACANELTLPVAWPADAATARLEVISGGVTNPVEIASRETSSVALAVASPRTDADERVFELTQRQWELVTGGTARTDYNHADATPGTCPVAYVSYSDVRGTNACVRWPSHAGVDADSFMGKLAAKVTLPAAVPSNYIFDIPTVAEWQYACRAGTTTDWNNGIDIDYRMSGDDQTDANLDRLGWYRANAGYRAHEVGLKLPNAWGLYDMHGNVTEWGRDHVMSTPSGTDPIGSYNGSDGKSGCSYRAQLGGAFNGSREGTGLSVHSVGLYTSSYVGRASSAELTTSRTKEWVGFRVALVYEKGYSD